MRFPKTSGASILTKALVLSGGVAGLMAIIGLVTAMLTIGAGQVNAKPEFSAQTKLPCGQCHQTASGGGPLTAFGKKFKDNGFKVK